MKKLVIATGMGLLGLTAAGQVEQNQTQARPAQRTVQVVEESASIKEVRRSLHGTEHMPVPTTVQPSRIEAAPARERAAVRPTTLRAVKRK